MAQKRAFEAWYAVYVDRFKVDGVLPERLQLKAEHGRRVMTEAGSLADSLGWSDEELPTAGVLGLLHDVGRFSQLAEFGTFNDGKSVDHGERGYEILLGEALLAQCGPIERTCILVATRHHNDMELPDGLSDDSLRFARLVRDADKLDLYSEVCRSLVAGRLGGDDDFAGKLSRDAGPSPEALECLRRRQPVPNSAVRSVADFLLWQAGWVFDVNYAPTMRRLRERSVFERMRACLPDDSRVAEALEEAIGFRDEALA